MYTVTRLLFGKVVLLISDYSNYNKGYNAQKIAKKNAKVDP